MQARGGWDLQEADVQSEQPLSLKPPRLKPSIRQGGASKELVLQEMWSQEKADGLWAARASRRARIAGEIPLGEPRDGQRAENWE